MQEPPPSTAPSLGHPQVTQGSAGHVLVLLGHLWELWLPLLQKGGESKTQPGDFPSGIPPHVWDLHAEVQGYRDAGAQGCRVQGRDAEIPFLGMLPGFPVTAGSPRQSHHRLLTTFIRETKEPSSVPADPSSQCWDTQCSIPKVGN